MMLHAGAEPEAGARLSTLSSDPSHTAPEPAARDVGGGGGGGDPTATSKLQLPAVCASSADDILARAPPPITLPPWQDQLPDLVRRRRLRFRDETPLSALHLRDSVEGGHFLVEACDDDDDHGGKDGSLRIPLDVEDTLFDAFVDDDYDGALHLTTIVRDGDDGVDQDFDDGRCIDGANGDGDTAVPLGIIFWREVPEDEMEEWIDRDGLAELARERRRRMRLDSPTRGGGDGIGTDGMIDTDVPKRALPPPPPGEREAEETWMGGEGPGKDDDVHPIGGLGDRLQRSLVAVRQESLGWLCRVDCSPSPTSQYERTGVVAKADKDDVPADYAQAWIKIELLAVRREHWGRRIGSLLLACAMYRAWLRNDKRCVLHIAGGTSNVPAVRLYERFGFVPATPGLFRKPDRDVYVLGNIDLALRSLLWAETLDVPELPCQ